MSTTGVQLGYGARVRIARGDEETMAGAVELLGVGDFDLPAGEAAQVDVTSHSSPNRTIERIPGLIDNGTMALPLDWLPNSEQDILLRTLKATGEMIRVGILPAGVPEAGEEVYAAYVNNYARSAPVQGKATGTVTFVINGLVGAVPDAPVPVAAAS